VIALPEVGWSRNADHALRVKIVLHTAFLSVKDKVRTGCTSVNGGQDDQGQGRGYPPSEATAVVRKFNALSPPDKQAILDFLRSL
jgi:hypothetical protein